MMDEAMIVVVTAAVLTLVLCFGLIGGAGALLVDRLVPRTSGVVAVAVAAVALGGAAVLVLAVSWVDERSGRLTTLVLVAAAIATIVVLRRRIPWRRLLPDAVLTAGVTAMAIGMAFLRVATTDPFSQLITRYYGWPLPVDNEIPSMLASWLTASTPGTFLVGDWLPSDRPPLQAGMVLMARAIAWPVDLVLPGRIDPRAIDFAAGVASQVLWIPGILLLLAAVGYGRRVAALAVVFAAVVPVVFVNTVFTWPKMLSAGYVMMALACLVRARRSGRDTSRSVLLAVALAAFGALAHGAAAFLLPALVLLAWPLVRDFSRLERVRVLVGAAAILLVVLGPWALFQRFVAPPGDRLMKWHLAGVVSVDERGLLDALGDQYSSTPIAELLSNRLENLRHVLDPGILFPALGTAWDGWIEQRAVVDFTGTLAALSFGALGVLLLALLPALGGRRRDAVDRWTQRVVVSMALCILVWALALFQAGAASVHQGSHAWVVVLVALPFAWLARRSFRIALAVIIAQTAYSAVIYSGSPMHPEAPVSLVAVAVLVAGATASIVALWSVRSESSQLSDASRGASDR